MIGPSTRRRFLAAAAGTATLGLAGCLGTLFGDEAAREDAIEGADGDPHTLRNLEEVAPDVALPLREPEVTLAEDLQVYEENAVSGGVGKDGIPSVDDPSFADANHGDGMLDPGDPIFGVDIDGDARAYPQRILERHEVVNDTFGDRGIAVTYCPLTGTAIGFERGTVEFGVSGLLVNSNLVMYDRAADALWPQMLGTCVLGNFTGLALHEVRVTWTPWGRWKAVHPNTRVLTEDTGQAFNYDREVYGSYNPRGGYYDSNNIMFEPLVRDERHHPKTVFIGARSVDGAVAFLKDRLREGHLVETTVGGVPYVAAYHPDLDSAWVYRNPDDVDISGDDGRYLAPEGQTYQADALPLESVNAFNSMWFPWAAFYPETAVVD